MGDNHYSQLRYSLKFYIIKAIFGYFSLSWILLILSSLSNAQIVPNPPLNNPPQPKKPQPLPDLPRIISPPDIPANNSIQISPEGVPGSIVVKKFEIIGDHILTPEIINQVVQPYLFHPISFVELLEVQNKITQLYIDRGYITTGAFIPPQTIEDRTIKIQIIEGKIEDIKISGLKRLKPQYVLSRLAIATKPPLNQNELLNALQLLQLDPLIAQISAELSAGIDPGTSFLQINVQEADPFALGFRLDNQRNPSVGSMRRQVELNYHNLLGWGDRFHVSYVNTDGSNSLDDLSYAVPINARNGKIELIHSRSNSEIISGEFQTLDIDTQSRYYELTYRQPLHQTPTQDFTLGFAFSRQDSATTLNDIPVGLSRGATIDGKTNISALRFWQEYSDRNSQQAYAIRSQFNFGIDVFNPTINENDVPDSNFFTWRGQAQYLRLLNPNTSLLLRSDLQLADRCLVSLEQFSSGGESSVRGYAQDTLLGDNGLFLSVELRNTIARIPKWNTSLELIPFVDLGRIWNSDNVQLEKNTLSSLGLGLQLLVGDNFTARIDWGIPLTNIESKGDSLQEQGVHFFLDLTAF